MGPWDVLSLMTWLCVCQELLFIYIFCGLGQKCHLQGLATKALESELSRQQVCKLRASLWLVGTGLEAVLGSVSPSPHLGTVPCCLCLLGLRFRSAEGN